MTAAKIAITIPADTLQLAKRRVKSGRAKSLSALVAEAVDEKLRRDELWPDEELGCHRRLGRADRETL